MFMDGTVRSAEEFEKDLFRPGSLPFLVLYDGQPCGVSWLNTLEGRAALQDERRETGEKEGNEKGRTFRNGPSCLCHEALGEDFRL